MYRINCCTFCCKKFIIIYRKCNLTEIIICDIWKLLGHKSTKIKAPVSTTNVLWHHYSTLILKSMLLYGEFVAKNETKAKMEIPQNLQNPATIYINVMFSQKWSESMH